MAIGQGAPVRRIRAVVTGRVQGVSFRASTAREAARLGLSGWVANRADGAVELEAAGPADAVAALVGFCRRGPRLAEVAGIEVTELEVDERPSTVGAAGFAIAADR